MKRREFVILAGNSWVGFETVKRVAMAEPAFKPVTAAEFAAVRQFVRTRHGRIAHVDQGIGDAVLFLHGFPLNSFQWRDSMRILSRERRWIAPDFLGLGYTEVAEGASVGPLDQCAMLVELLDAKGIRKVDVIANDSGGAVAQHLVAKHPERVRSLLLTNCDTEPDFPVAALTPVFEMARRGKFVDEGIAPWHRDRQLARSKQGLGGLAYSDPAQLTDEAIDYYFAPLMKSAQTKAWADRYALALETPNPLAGVQDALAKSRVPVCVVWGTADDIFSKDAPVYLSKTFGNVRGLRLLEGRKLFWPEERPDIIVEEARKLWRQV